MPKPIISLENLLDRAYRIAGLPIALIAERLQKNVPQQLITNKGWLGQLLEHYLGASAASLAMPDFPHLGVELKTLPLSPEGIPLESTYISTVSLFHTVGAVWDESVVWKKLQRVLWIPIIGSRDTPIGERIIGNTFLWEPSIAHAGILKNDWEEHMEKISVGLLEQIKSSDGMYLQIRPKAADSHVLCATFDDQGAPAQTLPRGFYLRTRFTQEILNDVYA